MKYLLPLLLLVACNKNEFTHTPASLVGEWELQKIEIHDNTGVYVYDKCGSGIPAKHLNSIYFLDLLIYNQEAAYVKIRCDQVQFFSWWNLIGQDIEFYSYSGQIGGPILQATPDEMVVEFSLEYRPIYYYKKIR